MDSTSDLADVIDFLISVVRDSTAKTSDRTTAAALLLDRALGRASQHLAVEASRAPEARYDFSGLDLDRKRELLQMINDARLESGD